MKAKIQQVKAKYRYSLIIMRQLVITDFKLRYQNSVLGYMWTLLRPLGLFVVLYIVFAKFLKVGDAVPHYSVYLLFGIVLWNYFTEVTNGAVTSIVGRGDMMRKLSFPRYTVVVAGSISALINLSINMLVIFFFMWLNKTPFHVNGFLIILPIIELFIFSLAVAFIISTLYVRFRDVNYIWEVGLQAAFYATPILYPISLVTGISRTFSQILMLNPLAQLIQDARVFLVTNQTQTINTIYGHSYARFFPLAIVLALAIIAVFYFKKQSPNFAEEV
jgi:ABC-2 type transport system permease protein